MVSTNQLIVDGVSTNDFSFPIFVTSNAGFVYAKKKNQIIETAFGSGGIKDEVKAWPPISKPYTLYCPTASLGDMRHIKAWAKDHGKLVSSDERDVFYEILDVSIEDTPINNISGYEINITFTTQPFGYEQTQLTREYENGKKFVNRTNAPMYPRITIYGNNTERTTLKIGEQTISLKELDQSVTIESKPLEQNIYDHYGFEKNGIMEGDFIEIPENSENEVILGQGMTHIEMLERWAWL